MTMRRHGHRLAGSVSLPGFALPTLALAAFVLLAAASGASPAFAQGLGVYDPDLAWPLCGRITEDPPLGWVPGMDCPPERFGDPAFHDGPISSSFGPRQLPSDGFRYDFHRGIDLPAAIGTPIFAVADGVVRKAGPDPSFTDPVIEIRHTRPGFASCGDGGGCYSSMYLHVSAWTVAVDDVVSKGDYIGQTGESLSEFEHLHFEIRDAPPADPSSSWQKECVHPLGALAYPDSGAANLELTLDSVSVEDPLQPVVTATVSIPMSVELDLETVVVELFERQPGGGLVAIPQPGAAPVGATVEGDGYLVDPPAYSMNRTSRQYTYKDSSIGIAYEEFLAGGLYESPYADGMPPEYDAGFHLDAADPGDFQTGMFNGMRISPIHYNAESPAYGATFQFTSLVGTASADDLCVKVRAIDALGNATDERTWNCPGHSCPDLPREDCRVADRSIVMLKKKDGLLDRVKWVFRGGEATPLADFGDPVSSTATTWSWCLWDASAPGEPRFGADVPTGGQCAGRPCWSAASTKGFRMKDRSGGPGGVTKLGLRAGDAGKTSIKVLGRGAHLDDAALPLAAPLVAQLIPDDGGAPLPCWQAGYSTTSRNDEGQLKAR